MRGGVVVVIATSEAAVRAGRPVELIAIYYILMPSYLYSLNGRSTKLSKNKLLITGKLTGPAF
jgi:hypothetical protein